MLRAGDVGMLAAGQAAGETYRALGESRRQPAGPWCGPNGGAETAEHDPARGMVDDPESPVSTAGMALVCEGVALRHAEESPGSRSS